MNVFKKIFGKSRTEPSPSPSSILNSAQARRAPRVSLTPLHRIVFIEKARGVKAHLTNISTTGFAVLRSDIESSTGSSSGSSSGLSQESEAKWTLGETHSGAIAIEKNEFEVELRVRHLSSVLAGCEFTGTENITLKRAIEVYLRIEILALTLRKVNDAYIKPDPRGKSHWYTDGRQNEVFIVVDEEGVVSFNMSFLGNYVEGNRGQAPRVGSLSDEGITEKGQKGSTLIEVSRRPTGNTLNLALTFIRNIDQLPYDVREEIAGNLSQSG